MHFNFTNFYKKGVLLLMVAFYTIVIANGQQLFSPDKNIEVTVNTGKTLSYDVKYKGNSVVRDNKMSLVLENGQLLGVDNKVISKKTNTVNRVIKPVYGLASVYKEHYNELLLTFKDNYSVTFRVFDNGVAYRINTRLPGTIKVKKEQVEYNFAAGTKAWMQAGKAADYFYEKSYSYQELSTLKNDSSTCLPMVVDAGVKATILETDLRDYPGMYLKHNGKGLEGIFQRVVTRDTITGPYATRKAKAFASYLAETEGTRSFPWRILALEEDEKNLLFNNLTYLLAEETAIRDLSWIKPGKASWDWWNANQLRGVNFKTGITTDTYKYHIDFAAKNNIPYVLIDEGWSDQFNLLKLNDGSVKTFDPKVRVDLDMEKVFAYAKEKNIGIIVWCVWHTLDKQMTEALDQFQKWGVKGVKVDFIERDDQAVVGYYERLAKEAAKRHMLVDFHGGFSPKGLERTYPNVVNYEAVKGLEWSKFGNLADPEHSAHIPFIRMMAGPMDYTPGAMRNKHKEQFKVEMQSPMSIGTRCHQLAMFTMFYAPLEMLADAPTEYEREPVILNYLSAMPTVWDATIPLAGKIGDFAVIARKSGTTWHVAGINDYSARTVKVKLDFLDANKTYKAELFTDGVNADRLAEDYSHSFKTVKKGDELEVNMAGGGGFAIKMLQE